MTNAFTGISIAILLPLLGGCGGHLSTQEATDRCKIERQNRNTMTDASFAECVACYEDCGDGCEAQDTTPEHFVCPP